MYCECNFVSQFDTSGLFCLPWCFLLSRKLDCIILRKIGRVGGDDGQVRSRVRHILSKIDSRIAVDVAEVHASFSLTIYELVLILFFVSRSN